MSLQRPKSELIIDSQKIRDNIIVGGKARSVAPVSGDISQQDFKKGEFKWLIRNDKTYLRASPTPEDDRYRSDFGYAPITEDLMFIKDGLQYKHYDVLNINDGLLPVDQRQTLLSRYFSQAEDRLFFGDDPFARAGGWTGISNAHATPTVGTHASTAWGATVNNVSTLDLAMTTLGAGLGYLIDGMEDIAQFPLFYVVTPDVYKVLLGLKDENGACIPQLLELLRATGNGSAEIIHTKWLGATTDMNMGALDITNGTSNSALMAWSPENYEIHTSDLISRIDQNPVDGLRINMEEAFLPTFYRPEAIIYEAGVTTS